MILKIMGFEIDIGFNDQEDVVLDIEDKQLYCKVIAIINALCSGKSKTNEIQLFDISDSVNFSNVSLIIDPFNIDLNTKKFISLLYSKIERDIVSDDELFNKIRIKSAELSMTLFDVIDDINAEFDYELEIPITTYLKSLNLRILSHQDETLKEKVMNYIEMVSELMPNQVLILCNMFSYFCIDDIKEICKYKNYKHLNVLFIDSRIGEIGGFKRYIIDDFYSDYMV